MLLEAPKLVDLLILGAGWTSTFLIQELDKEKISHAETSTTGRDNTIPFKFDPESKDIEPYKRLPAAHFVLVTFPLTGEGQSKHITSLYRSLHGNENQWIQLGTTFIYGQISQWYDEQSPIDNLDARAVAEEELLSLRGCILNLCGLYGGARQPRSFVPRIIKSKEDIKKRKAVHFVHGDDVARAIVATVRKFTPGKRWIITDLRVYDWYDLIMTFSAPEIDSEEHEEEREMKSQRVEWVGELMLEEGVRGLPRDIETLGRRLDGRGFWKFHGTWPRHQRLT